jgi:MoaA/NifB/PqqE/SkfB family radical SAM enzyme
MEKIERSDLPEWRKARSRKLLSDWETQDISDELLWKILPYLESAESIELHGTGEPLMYSRLFELIDRLPRGAKVGFNSNGVLLTHERIRRLVDSGLWKINFSLDAATPLTYKRIRGGELSRVLAGIKDLIRYRDSIGSNTPHVAINMTLMNLNIREAPRFVELGAELSADVVFYALNTGIDHIIERDGFLFDYKAQHPSQKLIERIRERVLRRAEELGVRVSFP